MRLEQMLDVIRYLRREIRCSSIPLPRLLASCDTALPLLSAMNCEEPFDLVSSYLAAKEVCRGEMLFCEDAWRATDRLFLSLGRGDLTAQEECFSVCETVFQTELEGMREKIVRNGKPALVLGCSVGAVFVLMFL